MMEAGFTGIVNLGGAEVIARNGLSCWDRLRPRPISCRRILDRSFFAGSLFQMNRQENLNLA